MPCCKPVTEDDTKNAQIDTQLKEDSKRLSKEVKLLLLGKTISNNSKVIEGFQRGW